MITLRLWIIALVLTLYGCSENSLPVKPPTATDNPQTTPTYLYKGTVKHQVFQSAITHIDYPLHIYLPPHYQNNNEPTAIIYATDGQWIFNGFAQAIEKKGLNIILIAIEQGPNDRRATDYLLPGARDYYQFLISELIPEIESQYAIDAQRRTLSGTSYGGLFVGLALLLEDGEDPYFKNYLSFDGSFYVSPTLTNQLLTERREASLNMHANLVLTSATRYGNDSAVSEFQKLLEAQQFTDLTIHRRAYAVVHEAVADPSFNDALDIINW
ncbi:alpha/beta hydrolase-fold protein [Alteromonadaceae bacterium BrNp21-10]|nr:alpha/beta hydrolase-fold protein [Alteromonadaceae bacterium BrNp21-10]